MSHAQKAPKGAGGGKPSPKARKDAAKKPEDEREETLTAVVCGFLLDNLSYIIGDRLNVLTRVGASRLIRDEIYSLHIRDTKSKSFLLSQYPLT
jgi:hypothetical protein